jgi:hypothetical protein
MIWKYLNWLNGTYWRLEYAHYLYSKGVHRPSAIQKAKEIRNKDEYYSKILMYVPIGDWAEFTKTPEYQDLRLRPFSDFTPYIIFLYITIGAGYEIVKGIQSAQVNATLPFILLSFLIFVGRIGYAYESNAKKTLTADYYGAIVMLMLLLTKLYYV